MSLIEAAPTFHFGLKFRRGDALSLRFVANRVRNGELGNQGASLYDNAAEATEMGLPLMVECQDPEEVKLMADAFVILGFDRPEIIDYNSRRR